MLFCVALDDRPAGLPRGPHGLSREDVAASQRGRLLQAMVAVVADKGYARCTVADVIALAGVSRATFYEQFRDKEECFLAAYDASVEFLLSRMAGEDGRLPRAQTTSFPAVIDRYLATIAAGPVVARIFLIEVYSAGPVALARRYAVLERFVDLMADVFDGAAGWPADPIAHRLRCEALVGALSSMVTTRLALGDIAGLPALREPILELAGIAA
jgi:AcrR family transcriptional regulator